MAAAKTFSNLVPILSVTDGQVVASPVQCMLTVSLAGHGSVAKSPDQVTYNSGAQVQLTATADAGWKFSGWTGDLASISNPASITMDSNKSVTATFTAIPPTMYTLTMGVSSTAGGTTSPAVGAHSYVAGTVVSISATPSTGYQFVTWTGNVSNANSASTTVTMDGSKMVTANFTEIILSQLLTFRFANPQISKSSVGDYFEFDVQIKASEAGTYFWEGDINLNFNNATFSSDAANWIATLSNSWGNSKYGTAISIDGSTVNINVTAINKSASSTDFVEISTTYQTIVSVRGRIISNAGTAGIDFIETTMNGAQFYKLPASPWYAGYKNPNMYDASDFMDTYVGRVYSTIPGWTQIGGLNWTTAVNTSVWDGNTTIPDGSLNNASALRIHSPATLTIPANGSMTVTGDTEIKTANGVTMQSDASGTGSLITETASGIGSALVQRYMTTSAWHIVSSPVSGQSISNFLTLNANVATSQDDAVRGMMDYNPALNDWNAYFTNAASGNLETGKGFSMRTNAAGSVTFTGLLQAGNQSASGLTPEMWNCIGNPYTSALGINTKSSSTANFLDTNIDNFDPLYGAIYLWDQPDASNGVGGKYTVISNVSDPFDVQQGQAYLVKLNSAATSIHFNSAMQIHNPGLALKSTKGLWSTIKLSAAVNNENSSAIIAFNSGMTKGLDPTYDAGLLKGNSDLLIYSRLVEDNGIPFAIQALPTDQYSRMIIPLGLDFKTGGQVVFSAELINLPSDCLVILEDKLSKTFTDLSKKVFTIAIAANSSISDRFYLHTSYQTTNLELETLFGKLSAYAIRNVEMIVKGDVSEQAVASLYDVQGRLVLTHKLKAGTSNTIGLPMIKTGIYMLYVKQNGKVQGFKVPVKE